MFNVMLDRLPSDWHGYRIDTDFRTGIQIMRCLSDGEFSERERIQYAVSRLFQGNIPDIQEAVEGLAWYMSEYNHDNHSAGKENGKIKAYDFDVDQWRIYSAFRRQYGIDLNHAGMHWFVFMGLLTNLEECSFTRVVDIRLRKAVPGSSTKEREELRALKDVYRLEAEDAHLTPGERLAQQRQMEIFNSFMNAGKE
ncbi:MAG: bacteriophage Gp15 family protein [Lachnospiraceae bacterium]|jgi:hypothetical protein